MKTLKEIKERAEAATKGPWRHFHKRSVTIPHEYAGRIVEQDWETFHKYEGYLDDAEFIAHARTDIPRLVKALETAIQDLTSIKNISKDKCSNLAEACLKDIDEILEGEYND